MTRHLARAVLIAIGVLAPLLASAQTRICSYAIDDWTADLDEIEVALEELDLKEAGILFEIMGREWECLSSPVPPEAILLYAQMKAFHSFHTQDSEGATRWSRAAEFMGPEADWPAWVPETHPIREMLEWSGPVEVTRLDGQYIEPPKKGGVFVNGRYALTPIAPAETPWLLQVYDKKGEKLTVQWQEGAAFPGEWLSDNPKVVDKAKRPNWWEGPDHAPAVAGLGAPEEDEADDEAVATAEAPEPEPEAAPEPEPEVEPEPAEEPEPEVEAEPAEEPEHAGEAPAGDDPTTDEAVPEVAEAPDPDPVIDTPGEPLPEVTEAADLSTATAPARSDADCPDEPVTVESIAALATQATEAFADTDREAFEASLDDLRVQVPCLSEIMDPTEAAVVHRLIAYQAFVDGKDPAALRSFQVALALDPDYTLPPSIAPEGGPLHALYERGREAPEVSRVGFGEPDGMTAFVDGAPSSRRPISAPALIQLRKADDDLHWSAYLTPTDPLPDWLPSVKESLMASVGEQVVDEFKELRIAQEERREKVQQARSELMATAEQEFTTTAEQARAGTPEGREALEAFVAKYDGATIEIGGEAADVVVPQVAAARAWLRVYGAEDAETRVAEHAEKVEEARTDVRSTASTDWKRTEQLIAEADYQSEQAIETFVETYDDARVEVDEATEAVFVPEVDVAKDWKQIYTMADDKLPDTADSLKVVLEMAEERKAVDRSVMKRISAETSALMVRAREDWATAQSVGQVDREAGKVAVERFVERYTDAAVVVEDERIPVDIPELAEAEAWLADPPEPAVSEATAEAALPDPGPTGPGKKARRTQAAIGVGAAAAGLYGLSWLGRMAYNASGDDVTFWVTDGAYVGSVALGTLATGLFIGALTTDEGAK